MYSWSCSSLLLTGLVLSTLITARPLSNVAISSGPVITSNFPDPAIIKVGSTWYAFGTNNGAGNIPMGTSTDLVHWKLGGDALPTIGTWAIGGNTWAPDVVQLGDGTFVLYYAATNAAHTSSHCIGAATSSNVKGPYKPQAAAIACSTSQGGAIDPAGFRDVDGKQYVVYKVDGNNIGHGGECNNGVAPQVPTPIMLQQLASNGVTPVGSPSQILDRSNADGPLIEAPSLVRSSGGTYVLFFSSGCYANDDYDVSYATSTSGVGGPYTKAGYPVAPLLVTGSDNGKLYSPGGLDVASDGVNVVFHADLGTTADTRQMWSGQISISGTTVTI
ncbi:hypothetical protein MMC25_005817 [Agyrium rufum]|nr:hypothetical protein [Agyrium rufum]